jgi:cation transport regulator ChaB
MARLEHRATEAHELPAEVRRRLRDALREYYRACTALDGPGLEAFVFDDSRREEPVIGHVFIAPDSEISRTLVENIRDATRRLVAITMAWADLQAEFEAERAGQ